ncbi:MAG: hypothetical protein P1U40_14130 [Coxiellaceae bacterium]|nr:hypothetical protein [Coxiellaceae bacterium]
MKRSIITLLMCCTLYIPAFALNLTNMGANLQSMDITVMNTSNHPMYVVSHINKTHYASNNVYRIICLTPTNGRQFTNFPVKDTGGATAQGFELEPQQTFKMHYNSSKPECQDFLSVADSLAVMKLDPSVDEYVDDDLNFQFYDPLSDAISFYADIYVEPSNVAITPSKSIIAIS